MLSITYQPKQHRYELHSESLSFWIPWDCVGSIASFQCMKLFLTLFCRWNHWIPGWLMLSPYTNWGNSECQRESSIWLTKLYWAKSKSEIFADYCKTIQIRCTQALMVIRFRFTDYTRLDEIPHPEADWQEFLRNVKILNQKQAIVFCPVEEMLRPWVDINQLQRDYRPVPKRAMERITAIVPRNDMCLVS